MSTFGFDDRHITWRRLGDLDHIHYSILDIDTDKKIADVLFKFEAHQPIILHRHKVLNKTFVVQGEHRIFEANGNLKEIRTVGSYTTSPAKPEPHRECGGDDGAVVLFSIRCSALREELYELLDDNQERIGGISFQDLMDLHREETRE
jgi:hypothetical protein